MGDNYYNNQYGPPPGSGSQYYAPPPREEYPQQGSRHGSQAYPAGSYAAPQANYSTYQPPREDQYSRSPGAPNLQVAPYRDDYGYDNRQSGGQHRDSESSYYPPSRSHGNSRSRSRDERQGEGSKKNNHGAEKSVGAALLGGAAGAFIGSKAGKGGLSTVVGALAGAYGGHELEKRREKHKQEKDERRLSESMAYGDDSSTRRRSTSRRRSSSRKKYSSSSESDNDNDRRRHRKDRH